MGIVCATTSSVTNKVIVDGEPKFPLNPGTDSTSVGSAVEVNVVRMVLSITVGRPVSKEIVSEELLLKNAVGRDTGGLISVSVTGVKTERAAVDAGVLSLDVSTRGPEPSSE